MVAELGGYPARRRGAVLVGALALAMVLSACGDGASADNASSDNASSDGASSDGADLSGEVIWADYGGTTNAARQAAYFDGFVEETGVDVISTSLESTVMYSMLTGEAGDYDAMHVGLPDVYNSFDHLVELDDSVPRDDQLPEDAQDYAFGSFAVGQVQAYLPETFPDGGPQTWADFFDTETFPGKRALPGSGAMNGLVLEAALVADGVAPEDLYPLDFERATAKLDTIADDVVFYTEYSQVQQLLLSGSVAVAYGPSGQFTALIAEGEDVTVSWDEAFYSFNVIVVPQEAPNVANAQALAAWMADPERQARFAELTFYGPGSSAAWDHIPDDVAENIVTAPSHTNLIREDSEARAAGNEAGINAYAEWLATVS